MYLQIMATMTYSPLQIKPILFCILKNKSTSSDYAMALSFWLQADMSKIFQMKYQTSIFVKGLWIYGCSKLVLPEIQTQAARRAAIHNINSQKT